MNNFFTVKGRPQIHVTIHDPAMGMLPFLSPKACDPQSLGGMACSLLDGAYKNLKNHLGFTEDIAPFRKRSNSSYFFEIACWLRGMQNFIVDMLSDEEFAHALTDKILEVQTAAADMDPYDLKREYGSLICFHGGVDTQQALRGTVQDVEKEVKKMLDALNHQGGYILSSCNHIQNDIPVENIIAMFETAKAYSKVTL